MTSVEIVKEAFDEASNQKRQALLDWLARLVTLSSGGLTLLVSLQNTYIPRNPKAILLLCVCWSLLGVTVLAGLLALYGEVRLHDDFQQALLKNLSERAKFPADLDPNLAQTIIRVTPYKYSTTFHLAKHLCVFSFAASIVCLCVFAILNLPPGK
jgi:hypothetical protein